MDFQFVNHGSIAVLTPISAAANDWVAEHLPEDSVRWAGGVVIEPRYADDILNGAQEAGLSIN
jgi:hypothetical protein